VIAERRSRAILDATYPPVPRPSAKVVPELTSMMLPAFWRAFFVSAVDDVVLAALRVTVW
jgi:hypothetical protein